MTAVLFIRADGLLKASHYKRITVPGHTHGGKWVDPYTKNVLVSDDHDTDKVAAGNGSFYQKQAHKKLSGLVDGFSTMNPDAKASLIVAHATDMQKDASASAAVSGFKSSMLAGKEPTTAQFLAMQNAPANVQSKIADACAATIGEDKYVKLLWAASAKANQTKGKKDVTSPAQAVETSPQGQAQGAATAAPAVNSAKPADVADPGTTVQATVAPASGPLHTFTGDGLEAYVSHGTGQNKGKFGVSLKDTDAGEFVQTVTFYPTEEAAIKSAKAAAGLKDASAYSVKKAPVGGFGNEGAIIHVTADFTAAEKLLGLEPGSLQGEDSNTYSVADASGQTFSIYKHGGGLSVRTSGKNKNFASAQTLAYFIEKNAPGEVGPKEGDTKTENGKTYKLIGGHWHRTDAGGVALTPYQLGMLHSAGGGSNAPVSDADFMQAYAPGDAKPGTAVPAMKQWQAGWADDSVSAPVPDDNPNTGPGNSANAVAAAVQADDSANHKAAVAAMETGAFYQKEAIKKLKAEHGAAWDAMHPSKQHELAHAKYQALQGAASQAAAVSGWKKHMLAGQVPTPSEVKAMAAFDTANPDKAVKVMNEVQAAIGLDKYVQLVTQAHAKAAKTPTQPAPAKVFVTTPPPVASVPSIVGKPAYAHLAQADDDGGAHKTMIEKKAWLAANPGKEAEFNQAVVDLGYPQLMVAVPGAAPVNEAKAKFKNNDPVNDFILQFSMHGGPYAQGLSIDDLIEPKMIDAFHALSPDEKSDVAAAISFYGPHKLKLFMDWVSAQNAKAAKPAGPVPVTSQVFTNTTAGHNKFWSVSVHGTQMKTTYGKLGTQGTSTTKDFASLDAAIAAASKLQSEKVAKGYKYGYTGVHQYDGVAAGSPPTPPIPAALASQKWNQASGGWVHQVSDGALSGAPSLSQDTKDGHTYYVAHTGDAFQVGVIDPDGHPVNHEDFDNPWDAAAQMGNYIDANNAEITHPSADDIQALNPAAGPKDGDTKMAIDGGTLVFKNGRWHKQGIVVPDFSDDKSVWGTRYADVAAKLKELFAAGGAKAIKPYIINHVTGAISIKSDVVAGVGKLSMLSGASAKPRHNKMHAFVVAMQAAGKGGKKPAFTTDPNVIAAAKQGAEKPAQAASSPKVFTTVPPSKPGVTAIDGWAQTGPQSGSNPGGKFKDKNGVEWYCKFPADKNVAMNEFLAAKFYEMLGVAVPKLKMVEKGGKTGIASKWVDGMSKATAAKLAKAKGVHEAFAIDAWLANWDVVGLSNDNLMLNKDGAAVHVDVGGSLVYRAQGGEKGADFGDTVPELETLKDPKKNDKSAAVFASATPESMQWGLDQLNKIKPSQITELCEKLGPGSTADKTALAAKLIARREFILKKFGIQDQWTVVHKLDPSKLPVNPADLPKSIQFTASSKAHVNAQNTKDSEALIAFASKGNLTALKDYLYDAVDKETSAPLGKKSILDHPSKPLKEQWAGLVELLQSISTPPMPTLTLPSLGSVGELGDISELVGFFNPQERVETVAAEHRMHFFMALSHIDDISGLVAGMKWSFLKSGGKFVQEAKAKHSSLSSAVKGYISSVQRSGSINHSWSQGKTTVSLGGKSVGIHGLTAKIYAEAQELPEGTTLIRGMSDTSSGKSMCKQLLACAPGTVIQNTDSMCASYNKNHSWGGDVQMTIRCAKGCKATLSFATGNYGGEHEITTLPGQRYVVLSTKKVGGTVHLEVLMLPPHEGYVSELSKLSALGKAILVCFKRMM